MGTPSRVKAPGLHTQVELDVEVIDDSSEQGAHGAVEYVGVVVNSSHTEQSECPKGVRPVSPCPGWHSVSVSCDVTGATDAARLTWRRTEPTTASSRDAVSVPVCNGERSMLTPDSPK